MFQTHYHWHLNLQGSNVWRMRVLGQPMENYPIKISSFFKDLPKNIDASYERFDSTIMFFKGKLSLIQLHIMNNGKSEEWIRPSLSCVSETFWIYIYRPIHTMGPINSKRKCKWSGIATQLGCPYRLLSPSGWSCGREIVQFVQVPSL